MTSSAAIKRPPRAILADIMHSCSVYLLFFAKNFFCRSASSRKAACIFRVRRLFQHNRPKADILTIATKIHCKCRCRNSLVRPLASAAAAAL